MKKYWLSSNSTKWCLKCLEQAEIIKNPEKTGYVSHQIQTRSFRSTLAYCSSYGNRATEMDFRYVVEECTLSKMSYSTARNSTWVQNGDRFPTELSSSLFLVFWEVPRAPKGAEPKNNCTNRKFRPRAIQRCTRFSLIFILREMPINYHFLWATLYKGRCTSWSLDLVAQYEGLTKKSIHFGSH